jgi:tuftelin-interacting protein 11
MVGFASADDTYLDSLQVRELSSASQITSLPLPDTSTRLPELRHNLQLIADMSKANLEHFTREQRRQSQEAKTLEAEVVRLTTVTGEEAKRMFLGSS